MAFGCSFPRCSREYPGERFRLIDAEESASTLHAEGGGGVGCTEALVVDMMSKLDGLEFLVVLSVNLDSVIERSSEQTLVTRSMMYRAITRAQVGSTLSHAHPEGWQANAPTRSPYAHRVLALRHTVHGYCDQ